jgi:hypothetical protein
VSAQYPISKVLAIVVLAFVPKAAELLPPAIDWYPKADELVAVALVLKPTPVL